jgi:polyisoprenoid-binding protein YceI
MPTLTKVLARTAAATSSATLYTVPSATTTVVSNIAITNTAGTAGTFTLGLGGVSLHTTAASAANTTVYIDLKQVLVATNTITGLASATSINFHISGVEIS